MRYSNALETSVYLNYASTSFPKSKIALDSFLNATHALPQGTRQHKSDSYFKNLRQRIGNILHIPDECIFFTDSATIGLNQVIRGCVKQHFCLAIDNRSHNATISPWSSLKGTCKCLLASIYDETDQFIEENFHEILKQSPHLLCLTHVSNVTGSIYPVERIIDIVHRHSPSTSILVDASQSAGALSLSCLNKADFIVFPSHKHLHSVPGAAVLVAKKRLEPIIFGGTGTNSLAAETLGKEKLFAEVGTLNAPAISALVDSFEFAESTLTQHQELERNLVSQFIEGINQLDGFQIIGRKTTSNRVGIVALKPAFGLPELHWAPFLHTQKIYVRGGLHCSPLHHEQLGLSNNGTLRFSFGWDSTSQHVVQALRALKEFNRVAKEML